MLVVALAVIVRLERGQMRCEGLDGILSGADLRTKGGTARLARY